MKKTSFLCPKLYVLLVLMLIQVSPLAALEIRTIMIGDATQKMDSVFLVNQENAIKVKLSHRNLSAPQKVPSGAKTYVVSLSPKVDFDRLGKNAVRVTIPESWEHCIIIFLPNAQNEEYPLRAIPVDFSESALPLGETLVMNFSRAFISIKMGKQGAVIKPGDKKVIGAAAREVEDYPVQIDYVYAKGDKTRGLCRSRWLHNPHACQLLFILPDEGRAGLRAWGMFYPREKPRRK